MNKQANTHTRWENACNKLIALIKRDDAEFPPEEKISVDLVQYTQTAFRDTDLMQYAMDRVFKIHRMWLTQNNRRKRREREQERGDMEEQIQLQEDVAASIKDIVTRIAVEHKIATADILRIKLSSEEGLIVFGGAENTKLAQEVPDMSQDSLDEIDFYELEEQERQKALKEKKQPPAPPVKQQVPPAELNKE